MADENKDLKQYADGWITEKKGTDVPAFLKFAFIVIAGGALTYLLIFMNGEITHSTRGFLVQQFNKATTSADGFMYVVEAMIAVYAIVLVAFVFRTFHED
jgi:hypothetical protein